jgi:DNA-binding response OmpR family regulator
MLAEDDSDAAESLQALLSEFGYEVHIVEDGQAALAAASVLQPRVIFLDIGLPARDERLRTRSGTAKADA